MSRDPKRRACVAYLRVSTGAQDSKTQRHAITRAAEARGDRIAQWFSETRSGASSLRPELDKLRAAARAGGVGRVYVFKVDRFTRRGIGDTLAIVEELRRAGCELVSVADGFDLGGPAADVVLSVMAWAAEQERAALLERVAAARERVEAAGGRWGRPRRLDRFEVARVRELYELGASVRTIAQKLGVPRSTVHDALSRD